MAEETTKSIKGAGTSFWRLKAGTDEATLTYADYLADTKWDRLANVKEITPGEITVEDEDDTYLDDAEAAWTKTTPGQKSAGDTTVVLAWKPGEALQQGLITDVDNDTVTIYRTKFPNGTVDAFRGYINSLGKAVTVKDKITRTVKFKQVGKPITAEQLLIDEAEAAAAGE
ncbi:phage tail tube protein [Vibrio ziniensis]|uniref:Phage tail protein n=1 Tax=Vibrio ziniensis TaxID=2711221 RepID=A0A6G7CH64_9VIBR|nr:phage tail tube protein [Vibrio ziniensis]QIH41455.1 phage tail protein [Vibrio ziniensis]